MMFQVTDIAFDFDDSFDEPLTDEYKEELRDGVFGTIWEADDEDDLVEEITCATGWCIKSIDYRHILSWIMNRKELQDQLVQQMLDDMDLKTMTCLCYDYLNEGYDKYSDNELRNEVIEYYPELLDNWKTEKVRNLKKSGN